MNSTVNTQSSNIRKCQCLVKTLSFIQSPEITITFSKKEILSSYAIKIFINLSAI